MTKWAAGRPGCVDYATQGDSRIAPTVTFTSDGPPDGATRAGGRSALARDEPRRYILCLHYRL